MKITNLEKWLYLVRRIEEHREEKAVKELQAVYKGLNRDLRKLLGNIYADYADPKTGKLTYAELHRQGLDARLLEEVAAHVNSVSAEEARIIRETVEQTYANCYSGMVQAVEKAVDREDLHETFAEVSAVKPEVIRTAVNNPVHGLTLPDQLEKNRADIVWGIKQAVGVGLSEGDNYTTMAKRIQKELVGPDGSGGSYSKAVRIARTEAHRVREEGNLDAAQGLTEKLEPAGVTMVKTWHTMKDERVRPNRARKTKGGWKYSKSGKYDHQKMEGVQVPINEEFKLPSGATTMAPGKSGVAGEDINCRCFLSYDVVEQEKESVIASKSLYPEDLDDKISISAGKMPDRFAKFKPDEIERKEIIERGIKEKRPIFADDELGKIAVFLPQKDDYYDVVLHGFPDHFEFFGKPIDVETLCAIIAQRNDYKKGTRIRLVSCNTGSVPDGVAKYIADKLKVEVLAPTKLAIITRTVSGHTVLSSGSSKLTYSSRHDGDFIPFFPG